MALLVTLLSLSLLAATTSGATYKNPVVRAAAPDPGVLLFRGLYYGVTTTGGAADAFPIRVSSNLASWVDKGYIFPQWKARSNPSWASGDFWAPEIHAMDNGKFNCYFVARHKDNGLLSVGVAVSDAPEGPFTDVGKPLIMQSGAHPQGSIDPTYFKDPITGERYVIWKVDGNASGQKTPILISRVDETGLRLLDTDFKQLITDDLEWEQGIVEAPWIIHRNTSYFLFYSGNGYASPRYSIGVARADHVTGPYTKFPRPVMASTEATEKVFAGPGHCSVVPVRNSTQFAYVYHAWPGHPGSGDRVMLLDAVIWNRDGWPAVQVPSSTNMPVPV